jgi:hypothetical protein
MPLFTYCDQCNMNPVPSLGDICPDCQKKIDGQRKRDKRINWLYWWLNQKPSRRVHEKKAGLR